jgi:DNA-directed RNA polymerase subunit RPC12/RpoP
VTEPEPFQLPQRCAQCGARPGDLERKKREAWQASRSELCPRCLAKWFEARDATQLPRCAACGRKVHTLHGGVCGDCKALGVEAPMLFEGPGT